MNELMLVLSVIVGVVWILFGSIVAVEDISNREIITLKDLCSDGYNWFGCLVIFSFRSFLALPFWILYILIYLLYKFIMWTFTV